MQCKLHDIQVWPEVGVSYTLWYQVLFLQTELSYNTSVSLHTESAEANKCMLYYIVLFGIEYMIGNHISSRSHNISFIIVLIALCTIIKLN